jgi:diamine N-acetyltransferase
VNQEILLSQDLSLVPLQLGDQPILYELMNVIYRNPYSYIWKDHGDWYMNLIYNPITLRKELSRDRSHYFFVRVKGEQMGLLKYNFPVSPREIEIPEAMKLHRLYLHEDYYGKGIAQLLMTHCEEVAKVNNMKSIWLEAMECQPQARRFYDKMGFKLEYTYQLDFEMMHPEYRKIQIMKKNLI